MAAAKHSSKCEIHSNDNDFLVFRTQIKSISIPPFPSYIYFFV